MANPETKSFLNRVTRGRFGKVDSGKLLESREKRLSVIEGKFLEAMNHTGSLSLQSALATIGRYPETDRKAVIDKIYTSFIASGSLVVPMELKQAFPDLYASPEAVREALRHIKLMDTTKERLLTWLRRNFDARELYRGPDNSDVLKKYFSDNPGVEEVYQKTLEQDSTAFIRGNSDDNLSKDPIMPKRVSWNSVGEFAGSTFDTLTPEERDQLNRKNLGYATSAEGLEVLSKLTGVDYTNQKQTFFSNRPLAEN